MMKEHWYTKYGWTQWLPYLARLNRDELLASIEEPNANLDRPEEPAVAAIWKAIDDVARIGQQAVTQRVGIFIRMELMRTEKHQNQYHPLQPYMEENAVADRIQKACLDFCIELLNQRITRREYDSALVYALAVQGVTPTGWREPGLYTAILSAIIKVGRFMVVQKALEMAGPAAAAAAAEGEEGEDGGEEFSSRGSAWDFEEEEEEEEEEEDGASGCGGGDTGSTQGNCSSQDSSRTGSSQNSGASSSSGQGGSSRDSSGRSGRSQGGRSSSSSQGGRSSTGQGGRSSSGQDSASSRTSSGQGSARDSSGRSKRSQRSQRSQMKMSCLELVTKMMDSFMIRGSHSPIQWILDLRTYGMKIHYNTTTKGHVGWNGREQLLYQGI
ncbi:uncharacterized protein LTHEOB_12917 [Neofusicoccum parvum]|uniref:Uncharacterized protein LTHEOB_12917 n=1 Tax=Neofusicoccum parvum TaxID=310453 RepID=A0ACB5S975_9PEZI|nr:uncharacterized protein LTHEOB_12917 [Neofusicoccum parvum]